MRFDKWYVVVERDGSVTAMKLASRAAVIVATLGSLLCGPSFAGPIEDLFQPQLGTMWVKSTPLFSDGNLTGCSMEYSSLIRDRIYKGGNFVNPSGSILVMGSDKNLLVSLKTVVNDLNSKTAKLEPDAPEAVYFYSALKTSKNAYVSSKKSDTPGGLVTIFEFFPTINMLFEGIGKGEIGISFRRKGGISDVPFTIDLTVIETDDKGKRTHSRAQVEGFTKCVMKIIDNVEASLKQKK
jgi:hypothetical protein